MFESLLTSSTSDTITLAGTLAVIGTSLVLGLFISLVYMLTHKKEGYSAGFTTALIMLPAIISIIILLVGNNVARAFSLAGAFSLIRFRSAPGDPKDIAYIFFTLGVGLACGMGYIGYAVLFAIILCVVMIILDMVDFAKPKNSTMVLKITVPENLNFQGLFDDVLSKYSSTWSLKSVKTSDFGTLFELSYYVSLKDQVNQKELLDELRCRKRQLENSLDHKRIRRYDSCIKCKEEPQEAGKGVRGTVPI